MSRSRRKTPRWSTTCQGFDHGEQWFKRVAHRGYRRRAKVLLHAVDTDPDVTWPLPREYGDPWNGPKDGKGGFATMTQVRQKWLHSLDEDQAVAAFAHCMRK